MVLPVDQNPVQCSDQSISLEIPRMCVEVSNARAIVAIAFLLGLVSAQSFNLNSTQLDVAALEKALQDKCQKADADPDLQGPKAAVQACLDLYVNVTQVQQELQVASQSGSMDEVFGKYCRQFPQVYQCLQNGTLSLRRFLSTQEAAHLDRGLAVLQDMQEFMCVKDGDRLALFVAEGGVQCLTEQQEPLQACFNSTGLAEDGADPSLALLEAVASPKACSDFDSLRGCVNEALEHCKDTTPANIIDATFKFLKKQIDCNATEPVAVQTVQAAAAGAAPYLSAAPWGLLAWILLM
uniref:27 kDa hemolymph protein n=1 Tax=Dendroctonus ponderosae TaxID=77166 RepID=J3JVX4_DENPD|nr:unknown [Dendroctonus ponderosae]